MRERTTLWRGQVEGEDWLRERTKFCRGQAKQEDRLRERTGIGRESILVERTY